MSTDKNNHSNSITVWSFTAFNFTILCSVVADARSSVDVGIILAYLSVALPSSFIWAILHELDYKFKAARWAATVFCGLAILSSYFVIISCFEAAADNRFSVWMFTIVVLVGLATFTCLAWLNRCANEAPSEQENRTVSGTENISLEQAALDALNGEAQQDLMSKD